ncbi:MAG TPA: hypothetical protein VF994_12670 [Myxococcales bacterium]
MLKPRSSQLWYRTVLEWIDAHAKKAPDAPRTSN